MHAVILAGGKGVRLRPYTTSLPKPLVPIGEEFSILEIVLKQLKHFGFTHITLAIGHLGSLIEAYVGKGERWDLNVSYAYETTPLGTIGPVLGLLDSLPEEFIIMNGDVLTDLNYADLLSYHRRSGCPLTVATYRREVKIDFGVLENRNGRIDKFTEKPTLDYSVSMGVYALSKETLKRYPVGQPFGFDQLVLDLIERKTMPAAYQFNGYWLDIGRPDDYDDANNQWPTLRAALLPGG
jgi:NDP-mannose synthase